MEPLDLVRHATPGRPALGTAISHAILLRVARGELGPTFRLHRSEPVLSFGRQDALSPGFAEAVRRTREAGFLPVLRLAGGRVAVFTDTTLAFAHATPEDRPAAGTRERFERTAELMVAALSALGVDARVGEVPGEYCPGAYSVNARGTVKIVGIGQRLIAGAAHVGGVIVASGAARVRGALEPVYEALGLEWDPRTAGSVADEVEGAGPDDVARAVAAELARRYKVAEASVDPATEALAVELAAEHEIVLD